MTTRICTIEGCEAPLYSKGFCKTHYARNWRHGDPNKNLNPQGSPEDRFWRFVNKAGDCWEWQGFVNKKGYGRFQARRGESWQAHRYSYVLHKGEVPDGMMIMHSCDNRKCVNPDHLSPGTALENTADMLKKGRGKWTHKHGEDSNLSILKEADVRIIRNSKERGIDLAKRFGVSPTAICDIRRGRSWKHVV